MEDNEHPILKRFAIVSIVVLLLLTGVLIIFMKNRNKVSKPNTTTVVAIVDNNKQDDIISLEAYADYLNSNYPDNDNVFLYDTSVRTIDFYENKKCSKEGEKVSINSNGYTVNYTCADSLGKNKWKISGKINNSISFNYSTNNTCSELKYYRINNYIVKVTSECENNTTNLVIYDSKSGTELKTLEYIITPKTQIDEDNSFKSNIFTRKGVLYYQEAINIRADEITNEPSSDECLINRINLNTASINVETLFEYTCDFVSGI